MNKLNGTGFISKIVFQRLNWKYNQSKLDISTLQNIVKTFRTIVDENGFGSVLELEGISNSTYNSLQNKMKESLIKDDKDKELYDDNMMACLVESLVYGTKMYMFCTYFAGDLSIMQIPGLRKVRGPFYDSGFTTVLDLALIYYNNYNSDYIKNIGPQKFDKFQRYFALDCNEFTVIKEDDTGI